MCLSQNNPPLLHSHFNVNPGKNFTFFGSMSLQVCSIAGCSLEREVVEIIRCAMQRGQEISRGSSQGGAHAANAGAASSLAGRKCSAVSSHLAEWSTLQMLRFVPISDHRLTKLEDRATRHI